MNAEFGWIHGYGLSVNRLNLHRIALLTCKVSVENMGCDIIALQSHQKLSAGCGAAVVCRRDRECTVIKFLKT